MYLYRQLLTEVVRSVLSRSALLSSLGAEELKVSPVRSLDRQES